ncbi:unnamed protein product [Camellia sinensis]
MPVESDEEEETFFDLEFADGVIESDFVESPNDVFFKGTKPLSPISFPRSPPKFCVLMPFKKPKLEKIESADASPATHQQSKRFAEKCKVEEVSIFSLLARVNNSRSNSRKQSSENGSSKRFAKDVVQKYMKLLRLNPHMKNQRNGREILWFAVELLRGMAEKNLFSWMALISGLVQSGQWIDGFNLFIEMRRAGVDIVDLFILSSIVGASANLAALELGKQIHCLVLSLGYESSLFVSNALVDMYAKCSDILAAKTIFDTMCRRDTVSWTSIIVGMAQHGRANESLSLHDEG